MKRLPIGISSFQKIITQDYLYVDKTAEIYKLITSGSYYFLSRPRRFGKSLLLSTLKELFSGNKALFEGLHITKTDYSWRSYGVLNFDFSQLTIETSQELKLSLGFMVEQHASHHGIAVDHAPTVGAKLLVLVSKLSQKAPVVILIDEYDYPLINMLHAPHIARANHAVLRHFFSVIKSLDSYLHAVWLTGVTKFTKTTIFSGLNNLEDITLRSETSTLCGYTQKELAAYFSEDIVTLAKNFDTDLNAIFKDLKRWYDGYRFSELEVEVYNPFSILHFLKEKRFSNYWFESGTPSFLVELLKKDYYELSDIKDVWLSRSRLGAFEIDDIPIITILFQTGYLSICEYDRGRDRFKLDYPNYEVMESFKKYLLAAYAHSRVSDVESACDRLVAALEQCDIPLFCSTLQTIFAGIPYHLHIPQERYYHSLFQLLASLLGMRIQSEVITDKGRIDIVLITREYIYIIEIKIGISPAIAMKQIKSRRYYERYRIEGKKIILLAITFNEKVEPLSLKYQMEPLNI